jgi:uncharacterized protein with PQ loop repeat
MIGWIASFLFAFCGVPQAWMSFKNGITEGLAPLFVWMWFIGEALMIIYVYIEHGFDGPLMFNYIMNLTFVAIILKYLYFPRK